MKNYLSSVFVNNRDPREYHWYKLIDYSFGDFYIIDSTEDADFTSDKLVMTANLTNEYLGLEAVYDLIDGAESEVTDMENIPYDGVDQLSNRVYAASSVKSIAESIISPVVNLFIEELLPHKPYVDYVLADGGRIVSMADTLNLFKEIV